jgi:hypothetical protein
MFGEEILQFSELIFLKNWMAKISQVETASRCQLLETGRVHSQWIQLDSLLLEALDKWIIQEEAYAQSWHWLPL